MWFMFALAGLAAASFSFASAEELEPEFETSSTAGEDSGAPDAIAEDEGDEDAGEDTPTDTAEDDIAAETDDSAADDVATDDAASDEVASDEVADDTTNPTTDDAADIAADDLAQVPEDPWLAGNPEEDLFVSTDEAPEEPAGPPTEVADLNDGQQPPAEPPTADELIAARDPWLDGVVDDEFLSTDEPSILT